jgi:crotonobetainyl-CoA:carnitine CoA-transferase CaiB-like acyl-CoA transferase
MLREQNMVTERQRGASVLDGVKILDLSQILAGPLSSMILGDLGADVIKIEPPEGDAARTMGDTFLHGVAHYLLTVNRNKRSIVLDLKGEEGRQVFYRLAREADVVLENFRPGTVEKLGVDYATIGRINPRIIYCSISGFGQDGPYKDRPAMDPIIQAMGGMMGITGDPQTGPQKVGAPIGDTVSSLLATIGILAALRFREKTGKGQKVEISMLDGIVFMLIPWEAHFFIKGKSRPLTGNRHFQLAPCDTYRTQDGGYLMLIVHNQKHWANLCECLSRPELIADPRFQTNPDRLKNGEALNQILREIFKGKTQKEWVECLIDKGVMIAPVYTFEQLFQDPQIVHDRMVAEIDHPKSGKIKVLNTPIRFSKTPARIEKSPPLLGQHNREVLLEFGFQEKEIQQLKEKGVIKDSK